VVESPHPERIKQKIQWVEGEMSRILEKNPLTRCEQVEIWAKKPVKSGLPEVHGKGSYHMHGLFKGMLYFESQAIEANDFTRCQCGVG